jgi:hypothetical protein
LASRASRTSCACEACAAWLPCVGTARPAANFSSNFELFKKTKPKKQKEKEKEKKAFADAEAAHDEGEFILVKGVALVGVELAKELL